MKIKARLTASATPAVKCILLNGANPSSLDRFLERCDKVVDQVFHAAVWAAVVCAVALIATQSFMYTERTAHGPEQGGYAWQTR